MAYTVQDDGFYHIPIIDLGERLRDNFGLTIREHEHFDPVDPVHAPNSYHKYGYAIDVQDWRPDIIDGVDWKTRTKNLETLLQGSGAENLWAKQWCTRTWHTPAFSSRWWHFQIKRKSISILIWRASGRTQRNISRNL